MAKLLLLAQTVDKNDSILGFFHEWILELSGRFSEVHIICLKKGVFELPPHIHVYSLGKEEGESRIKYVYRFYKYFSRLFFTVKPTYVFFHQGAIYNVLASPFFLIRGFFGSKFLWWKAHGHINAFGRFASLFCDEILTSTASGFPTETPKRRIVGQAIDTRLFAIQKDIPRINTRIIFVGRITAIKHIEVFIAVIQTLSKLGIDVEGRIIGPVGDQDYFNGLKTMIAEQNIANIRFVGSCSQADLVTEYSEASIFLNTSLTHSMDKTVLEAVLCGCLPITANHAFEELLGPYDLYFEKQTIEGYVSRVKNILDTDTVEMRRDLHDRVQDAHSLNTFANRVFDVEYTYD